MNPALLLVFGCACLAAGFAIGSIFGKENIKKLYKRREEKLNEIARVMLKIYGDRAEHEVTSYPHLRLHDWADHCFTIAEKIRVCRIESQQADREYPRKIS